MTTKNNRYLPDFTGTRSETKVNFVSLTSFGNKKLRLLIFCLALTVFLGILFCFWFFWQYQKTEVVFLNVGQGDAILISQGTNQILIDGGRSSKELLAHLGRHMPFWDRRIEAVIATHPDADHIGGLPALFRAYQIGAVFYTGAESDTETDRLFLAGGEKSTGHALYTIFHGGSMEFPKGGKLSIEYPQTALPKEAKDTNEGSIVARFVYGETSFLLTGDLPHEETVLLDEAPVTVLKVAHHGSKYSSSEDFLKMVEPKEAIISVGQNSYGHPNQGVLERLQKIGSIIHRTDQEGDIVYTCLAMIKQCHFVR